MKIFITKQKPCRIYQLQPLAISPCRIMANLQSSKLVVKARLILFDISFILLVKQYAHTFP